MRLSFRKWLCSLNLFLMVVSVSAEVRRPKVGLVLSGGGARGFAHVGVLKMLDDLDIPVDFITGTSMGGIAGGLYAIGYSGREIETLAFETDWLDIFNDQPKRQDMPYVEKKETGKYQMTFGFDRWIPDLPGGLIIGQNISQLLASLTYPYEGIRDFNVLPIPFKCVAADLLNGEEVILENGSLSEAMRITMSIPSVFTPVIRRGRLLVDGGLLNNLPVDVVREMGADIVIAVDVMGPQYEMKETYSAMDVFEHAVFILAAQKWKDNIDAADIVIRPDLKGFTVADFFPSKIRKIIASGDSAAALHYEELVRFKTENNLIPLFNPETEDSDNPPVIDEIRIMKNMPVRDKKILGELFSQAGKKLSIQKFEKVLENIGNKAGFHRMHTRLIPDAVNRTTVQLWVEDRKSIEIDDVVIEGNAHLSETFILRILNLAPGDVTDAEGLNRKITRLYGYGYFESVLSQIEVVENNRIRFMLRIKEKPLRRLRLGFHYDNYLNLVGRTSVITTNFPFSGLRFEHEFFYAGFTRWQSKIFYPSKMLNLPVYPFGDVGYQDIPGCLYDTNSRKMASFWNRSFWAELGLGVQFLRSFDLEFSYCWEWMNVKNDIVSTDYEWMNHREDGLREMKLNLNVDTIDDRLLPRKGVYVLGGLEYSSPDWGSDTHYLKWSVSADYYQRLLKRHGLRFYGLRADSRYELPFYKFHSHGRPEYFVGQQFDQLQGESMTLLRVDYRFEINPFLFWKLMTNTALNVHFQTGDGLSRLPQIWGFGTGLKLHTPLGNAEVILGWGDKEWSHPGEKQWVGYLSVGARY